MSKNNLAFYILFATLSTAFAQVQTLELKEYPPLKPLNYCKDSNGVTRGQNEPCGPDTTVGSSITTPQQANQSPAEASPAAKSDNALATAAQSADAQGGAAESFWKQWGKWIGIAFGVFLLLKWLRRSS